MTIETYWSQIVTKRDCECVLCSLLLLYWRLMWESITSWTCRCRTSFRFHEWCCNCWTSNIPTFCVTLSDLNNILISNFYVLRIFPRVMLQSLNFKHPHLCVTFFDLKFLRLDVWWAPSLLPPLARINNQLDLQMSHQLPSPQCDWSGSVANVELQTPS